MEKNKMSVSNKIVCPKCNGNGYRMIYKDASWTEKTAINCSYCENQGEVVEQTIPPQTLREQGAI